MTLRDAVAILTAILRMQHPSAAIETDALVMQALAMARGGIGERELVDALDTILGGMPPASDILLEVDMALAMQDEAPAIRDAATLTK